MIRLGSYFTKYFSTLKYPFPSVQSVASYVSADPKEKVKRIKLIQPTEIDSIASVSQQNIKEFKKMHKVAIESNGSRVEYVNSQRSNKVSLDAKTKSVISMSEAVANDPGVNGVVSDVVGSCYEFHLKTLEERKEQPEIVL